MDDLKLIGILLFNSQEELFVTKRVPSYWPHKWDISTDKYVKSDLPSEEVARNLLTTNLGITSAVEFLGNGAYPFTSMMHHYESYRAFSNTTPSVNRHLVTDARWMSLESISKLMLKGECAPTLEHALEYLHKIA